MANSKSTQMWFAKAREDLKVAKHLHPIEKDFLSGIVFHCQQSTEKSIKGFLTFYNVRILKTHDMQALLVKISEIHPELADKYKSVINMTTYAVEYRYPDFEHELPPLNEELVIEAINLTEQIFNELTAAINEIQTK